MRNEPGEAISIPGHGEQEWRAISEPVVVTAPSQTRTGWRGEACGQTTRTDSLEKPSSSSGGFLKGLYIYKYNLEISWDVVEFNQVNFI